MTADSAVITGNRAHRRRLAKKKPACAMCGERVTHRDMAGYRNLVAHQSCAADAVHLERDAEDEARRHRLDRMGLQVVDAGELLARPST